MTTGTSIPGPGHWTTPVMGYYTPVSDYSQSVFTHQGHSCEQFELNFFRCCEAFGMVAAKRKCDLEYRDFIECVFRKKQMGRYHAMRKERMKQFLEGKLDRPWTKNPPKLFDAHPDYYSHEPFLPDRTYH